VSGLFPPTDLSHDLLLWLLGILDKKETSMLRIKTFVGEGYVYTTPVDVGFDPFKRWITMTCHPDKTLISKYATNLFDAGQNHLFACQGLTFMDNTLEQQIFSWSEWDEESNDTLTFYQATLKVPVGKFPVGTVFKTATVFFGQGMLSLIDDQEVEHLYRLNLSVGEPITDNLY
jgi:hypothetical protein